jgi:hypothetical protein
MALWPLSDPANHSRQPAVLHRSTAPHERYADPAGSKEEKESIQRYLCRPCGLTFSVLPPHRPPYRPVRAERLQADFDKRAGIQTQGLDPPPSVVEAGCLQRAWSTLTARVTTLKEGSFRSCTTNECVCNCLRLPQQLIMGMQSDEPTSPMKQNKEKEAAKPADRPRLSEWLMQIGKWFGGLATVCLAIGAYSTDSIGFRLLHRPQRFSVASPMQMGGSTKLAVFRPYATTSGELLAPVHTMIFLDIRNASPEPQLVKAVEVEFMHLDGTWIPARVLRVDPALGIYSDPEMATQLKQARKLNFEGEDLLSNLGAAPIPLGGIVSGWVFLELPPPFREHRMSHLHRITLFSGFGEKETYTLAAGVGSQDATETRFAQLRPGELTRDLSALEIVSEYDLFERFRTNQAKSH